MTRVKVAQLNEVPPGKMIGLDIQGKRFVLANVDGKLLAADGRCTHMSGHLWEGKLSSGTVRCPKHGAEFDLATGKNTKKPWLPLGKAFDLKTYSITIEGEDVYLEL